MHLYVLLLMSLAFVLVSSLAHPIVKDEDLDITVLNKDLDLFEGDIKMPPSKTRRRRSIRSAQHRWPLPAPYDFGFSLDINAKGVILRAFEQFRLKTCIDFRPKIWSEQHIAFKKYQGCWSQVGRQSARVQELSIGPNCDTVATVEHELMHALGFWHEQSRYDRDNYISINWQNIEAGEEHNFEIRTNDTNSTMDTPYDYLSVLHYPKEAFSNGNGLTIITKQPEFQDAIGQRLDMSHYDVEELNRFYGCNESISFMHHCSFDDESMCEMKVCSRSSAGWERVKRAVGGPHSDHTYLGTDSHGTGFFMHVSTKKGRKGDSARLQTRRMTPKRSCKVQCLEFFYYHSGSWSDQLNIWIREFDSVDDIKGTRRLMGQIRGFPDDYWQLHHVPLNATKTFQVEFEARKGAWSSRGGFSVDDINLSETECPHHTWQIRNLEGQLNANDNISAILSPKYYSSNGYRYQLGALLIKDSISVYARLVSGSHDYILQWPCPWMQVTFMLLDQNSHIQKRMSKQRSITTNPSWLYEEFFGKPSISGKLNGSPGMQGFFANEFWPKGLHLNATELRSREFLKGGDGFLLISMQDISRLHFFDKLPCPSVSFSAPSLQQTDDDGPCGTESTKKVTIKTTTGTGTIKTTTGKSTTVSLLNATLSTVRSDDARTTDNPPVTPHDRCANIFSAACNKVEVSPGGLMLAILFVFILGILCRSCCSKKKKNVPYAQNAVFGMEQQ